MPSNLEQILLQCGCGCSDTCIGCCFCGGFPATNVEYEIEAPSCPSIDGQIGNISGPDVDSEGTCGQCVALINNLNTYEIPQYVWDDSLPENGCVPQPDSNFNFSFFVICNENQPEDETDPGTTEECCRNIRLVITDGAQLTVLRIIPPLSCVCVEGGGLMAIFDLSVLAPDCTTFYTSGVCEGRPTCGQLGDPFMGTCSLTGARLHVSQAC